MPTRTWKELEQGPRGAIVRDLRQIITDGYNEFDAENLEALPDVFADARGRADAELIRERLLELLLASEPSGADPDRDYPDALTPLTQISMLVFRVPKALQFEPLEELRAEAGKLAKPAGDPITERGFRKPGGREYKLVKELSERIGSRARSGRPPLSARVSNRRSRQSSPEDPGGPSRPDRDVHSLYHSPKSVDIKKGFWWRETTDLYIEQLADPGLTAITIYAGADGDADVGPPLHRDLMRALLSEALRTGPVLAEVPETARDAVGESLLEVITTSCSPAFVGSIVRQLYRTRAKKQSERSETRLFNAIENEIELRRSTEGFVAQAIDLLAFTLRASRRDVKVISAHYDTDIAEQAARIRRNHPHLEALAFIDCEDRKAPASVAPDEVPLLRIHGRKGDKSAQPLVVGEADFIADEAVDSEHTTEHVSRFGLLAQTLSTDTVIFVGTSLTDPGVLAALAATRHRELPRYAILLAPDITGMSAAASPRDYALFLSLFAQRYLHLGVVPIIVDFKQQVPQFLREVALRLEKGYTYESYGKRLQKWWITYANALGHDNRGRSIGHIDPTLRHRWRARLIDRCASIEAIPDLGGRRPTAGTETIKIEVWLRNHYERKLFLVATSAKRAPKADEAPEVDLLDYAEAGIVQTTFREGRTIAEPYRGSRRWKYVIAMPLVLHREPWHHLPVGVITVMSTHETGTLSAIGADYDYLLESFTPLEELIRRWLEHPPSGDSD